MQPNTMEKSLAVYPIPNGNELNIFTTGYMNEIRIMNMSGEVVVYLQTTSNQQNTVNIASLPSATYIVEVAFDNNKTSRSVFVKI